MSSQSSASKRLASYLDREDLTLDELVQTANQLLRELVPRQSRYKVTERPDARTIRYYVTQKLLPKPVSYEGGRARYSGAHLARLLMIKKLQAEHHTLERIARVLGSATDEDILRELFPSAKRRSPAAMKRVRPELLVSAGPTDTPEMIQRHALGQGASLDLPERALKTPRLRAELADQLESLARSLRETPAEDSEGGSS
jgi:DNA-binding transcriptional MerR regulator